MEMNLSDIGWPECMIQCNDALAGLQPGEDLIFTVGDADVLNNMLLLIRNKRNVRCVVYRLSSFYQIRVNRIQKD